jgi:hypothetical protein
MTPELRELRLGKLTASKAAVIMGDLKTDGLKRYVRQLAGERLYGDLGDDSYKSAAMDRGNDVEADALDWYEFETDQIIERGPHINHPLIPYVAATPDGIIRGVRVIEAKSPLFTTWAEIKERREVPSEYRWQTRWQLWNAELRECHFVAWHKKPQGLIIECTVTQSDIDQMAERAALVEARIRQTMEIISERKAA